MKLLFIENRYKTFTYEAIANQLKKEGHTISFLIQNREFKPKSDHNYFEVPFPGKNDLVQNYESNKEIEEVITSDRMQNFFMKKGTSYFYYYDNKIGKILDQYKPDLVFGESTAFHELLTIHNCKLRNILYLNPSTCRYPKNRFSFYLYDTLEPYEGSGETLSYSEAKNIVNGIVNRSAKPDYMKVVKISKAKTINDKVLKITSYLKGDSFNTPHPIVKYRIEREKNLNIKLWDTFAKNEIAQNNKTVVLYPLQMQPEANIDVWGRKHRDQLELIQSISEHLPADSVLVVKPNPKSKYELSKDLITYIKQSQNVIALQHSVKMDDIISNLDLVMTVTGTIAMECILSNIPVITLVKTLNNNQSNCRYISDIKKELSQVIEEVQTKTYPKISDREKIEYINYLNKTSYQGIISDPFSDANCISKMNLDKLLFAFKQIIK